MKTTHLLILLIMLMMLVPCAYAAGSKDYGYAVAMLRAGGSASDKTIWVCRPDTPFNGTWRPDGSVIESQNPGCMQMQVLPDGRTEPKLLQAGKFDFYLQNGNGNQQEHKNVIIGNGATEYVSFLGSAVAIVNHTPPACIIPEHWEYRFRDWVPEGLGWVWHEEVNHTITVSDGNEWDEPIYHQEVNHTIHHDAVYVTIEHPEIHHTEYRTVTKHCFSIYDRKWFNNDGWKVKCTNHAEHGEGWHVETPACTECLYTYGAWSRVRPIGCTELLSNGYDSCVPCYYESRIVVDHEAWTERILVSPEWDQIIVDVPAWVETIHHDATTHQEIVVDILAWGEWVVISDGYWTEWSVWATENPLAQKGREIESRWVEKVNRCCCNCNEMQPVQTIVVR